MCFQKNKLKELIQMNENKTNINCEKTIYRKFIKTFENTHFFAYRFFRI